MNNKKRKEDDEVFLKNVKNSLKLIKIFLVDLRDKAADAPYHCRLLVGTFMIFFALIVNGIASRYIDARNYKPAENDWILELLKIDAVSHFFAAWILSFGFVVLIGLIFIAAIYSDFKRVPFIQISISLLYLIRSFTMTLTRWGVPADHLTLGEGTMFYDVFKDYLIFKNDLFFSAHTALPFLMALLFYKRNKKWWCIFSFITILFAFGVLKIHGHLAIDVAMAFAAPYLIFNVTKNVFGDWDTEKD